jgi:hypothetical protein
VEKRPVSLTIIGWLLGALSLFAILGAVTMGSNPIALKMLAQMHIPLAVEQMWSALGAVVNVICAYGILKGRPWSRVLYAVWGSLGLIVSFYISPIKAVVVLSLVIFVVIVACLWTNNANDWFSARGFMLKRERNR